MDSEFRAGARRGRLPAVVLVAAVAAAACADRIRPQPPGGDPDLPDPLAAGWRGQPVCERLHEDVQQRVLRCTFPPGGGHERHYHAPHFGYAITTATMEITDSDGRRTVSVAAGDSWTSDGVAWHEVRNVGPTTGVYLIVEPRGSR